LGYDGLEIRGIEGEMHLPKARPFRPEHIDITQVELAQRNLKICCLGTSAYFHDRVAENLANTKEHIDLAAYLGVPYVRVFGNKILVPAERERTIAQVGSSLQELGEYAAGSGVKVLIESHGDFAVSADMLAVFRYVESPNVGVLWDVHHPYRMYGEAVAKTFDRLGDRIYHVHLKDSRPDGKDYHYCLPGAGDVPLVEILQLLHAYKYDGWLSFEWEKQWHPEIEDPELALPAYVAFLRPYLA
jgi:sugar phosphate isomerase/epimerase